MAEKLLVCDALDERDFLRKKIMKAIDSAVFVGSKRIKDTKVGAIPTDSFEESAKSSYQSIVDLIKRYQSIDMAITLANATTDITTRSGRVMKRAEAIALRKSLNDSSTSNTGVDFTGRLLKNMTYQYNVALGGVADYNKKADTELESYKMNLTGRDSQKKLSDDDIDMLEKLTADLHGELVDPIGIKAEIDSLSESYNNLIKELDSAIKISNATTYIEF